MEIKVAFSLIIGILMMATVIVAVVAMLGGLTKISVEECQPAVYTATTGFKGEDCGIDSNNNQVRCDVVPYVDMVSYDKCTDTSKNECCPLYSKYTTQYTANKDYRGNDCGSILGVLVKCDMGDVCSDSKRNSCFKEGVRIVNGKCCKITVI